MAILLRPAELYRTSGSIDIDRARRDIAAIEEQQPEGTRMELEIGLRSDSLASWVADQINRADRLIPVHRWPGEQHLAFAQGNKLFIRWYKQPTWAAVIMAFLVAAGIIATALVVYMILRKYEDIKVPLLITAAVFVLIATGPSFFQMLGEYYRARYAQFRTQQEALETLQELYG